MNTTNDTKGLARGARWESEWLDLDAYLGRIGYNGPMNPDIETLHALQRAHLDAVAFENLDVITGGGVRLDLASLQDKLVYQRRGGYCHEQNILFATVLDRIGFDVSGRSARILMGDDAQELSAVGHTCLNVHLDGTDWLVDVGVGHLGPRGPVPLREGVEIRHDCWLYRMDRTGEGRWLLQYHRHDGWFNVYQFSAEPYYRVDYEDHNYTVSTHPESHFVHRIVAQYNGGSIRYGLTDCELKVFRPGDPPEQSTLQPAEIPRVLRELFGLDLPGEAMTRLVERALAELA